MYRRSPAEDRNMTSLMRDNRGFSLVELLVSMLLMSIVLGIAARSLTEGMRASEAISLMGDVNQNIQSSQTMMVRDFLDAGRNLRRGGLPLPDGPGDDVVRPGPPNVAAAVWPTATTLYAVTPWNELGPTINGNATDAVTIVTVDDLVDMENSWIAVDGSGATVTMVPKTPNRTLNTNSMNTIREGDLMWVTRNGISAVLYVTSIESTPFTFKAVTSGDPSKFNQQGATTGSMAQVGSTDLAPPLPKVAEPDTSVKRIRMISYWVEEQAGMPYLMRQENYRPAVPVGLGVENLELQYELFANGAMRRVSDPFSVAELNPVASPNEFDKALLVLAVRSDRKFAQTTGYLRNDLTTQVSLRSLQVQQNFK
jgi:prepilin-type N-terminal cleavage/methylation domain-containing protein